MPSSSMPWIKLYTEILDDPKIGYLPDEVKWRFVQLIILAGKCDAEGYLIDGEPMTLQDIAWRLRIELDLLDKDIGELERAKLINFDDEFQAYLVTNFAKRQGRTQEERRKQWRDRQRRHRETEKESRNEEETGHDDVTGDEKVTVTGVTLPEGEEEKEGEEEEELKSSAGAEISEPPENPEPLKPPDPPEDPPEDPNPQATMVGVLSKVTGLDYKIPTNAGRLAKRSSELLKAGYSSGFIQNNYSRGGWWYENDWRGKNKSPPTPEQVCETVGQIDGNNKSEVDPPVDDGFMEKHERTKAERRAMIETARQQQETEGNRDAAS